MLTMKATFRCLLVVDSHYHLSCDW